MYHYFPTSQLDKLISDTKQELKKNYEKILDSINIEVYCNSLLRSSPE